MKNLTLEEQKLPENKNHIFLRQKSSTKVRKKVQSTIS